LFVPKLCETIDEIQRVWNVSQSEILEDFIRKERPFIVTDAMEDWQVMNTDKFWFDNITEVVYSSFPCIRYMQIEQLISFMEFIHKTQLFLNKVDNRVCNINTNLRLSDGNLGRILKKLYSPHTNEWFLHW